MIRSPFFILMLVLSQAALADVYMWKDPVTGKTRMTNIPPPWVKDPPPGRRLPKVEVMRDNKVLDPKTALANPQPQPNTTAAAKQDAGKKTDDDDND